MASACCGRSCRSSAPGYCSLAYLYLRINVITNISYRNSNVAKLPKCCWRINLTLPKLSQAIGVYGEECLLEFREIINWHNFYRLNPNSDGVLDDVKKVRSLGIIFGIICVLFSFITPLTLVLMPYFGKMPYIPDFRVMFGETVNKSY